METLMNHWSEIVIFLLALLRAAEVISNMTPSETDNKIVEFLNKIVGIFSQSPKKPN